MVASIREQSYTNAAGDSCQITASGLALAVLQRYLDPKANCLDSRCAAHMTNADSSVRTFSSYSHRLARDAGLGGMVTAASDPDTATMAPAGEVVEMPKMKID